MDIQKERKAFEKLPEIKKRLDMKCVHFNGTWYATSPHMGNSFATASYLNGAWKAWQAAKAQAVPEWISVENKLPKRNIKVLLNIVARRRGKPFSCIGFYSVEPDDEPCFILDDNFTILKGVTHWMQLPQAPKAQEPTND